MSDAAANKPTDQQQIPARRDDALFPPPTILNVKNPFDREKLGIALQDDSDDNNNDDDTAVFFDGNVLNISLPVQEGEIAPYDGDLDGLRDEVGEAVRGALGEAFKDEGQGQDQAQVPYPPVVRVEVSGSRRDEQQRILINARSDDSGIEIGESSTTDGITSVLPGSQDGTVRQTTQRAPAARPETVKFELEDAVVSTPVSDIGEYEYPNNIFAQSEFDPAEYEYDVGGGGYLPWMIFRMRAPWLRASNGWRRVHISYRMHPSAQTSDLGP